MGYQVSVEYKDVQNFTQYARTIKDARRTQFDWLRAQISKRRIVDEKLRIRIYSTDDGTLEGRVWFDTYILTAIWQGRNAIMYSLKPNGNLGEKVYMDD